MADYGVNIKFRTIGLSQLDKAKAKAKELETSVSKIRSLDLGKAIRGKVGDQVAEATGQIRRYAKQVNQTGKVIGATRKQQMAALEAFEMMRDEVAIGSVMFNEMNEAIANQTRLMSQNTSATTKNASAKKKQAMFPGMNQGFLANARGAVMGGGALTSGLVSGAFPLLFGQGLAGGIAGFTGGFAGTKLGGKMGGFAGGLVATAVLQQLTTLAQNMSELGRAFDELNPNVQAVTTALGLAGSVEEKRLLLIEKTHGAHVALAEVTEKMNDAIGEQGVKNLTEFAEATRLVGNEFKKAMTRIQAAIAPFLSMFLVDAQRAENTRLANLTGDTELANMRSELERLEGTTAKGASAVKKRSRKIQALKNEIIEREKLLAVTGKQIEKENFRNEQFIAATKSLENQNTFLQNQLLLGQQGAEIEKLKLETAKKMEIAVKDLTPEQVKQLENLIKTRDQLKKINELYSSIGSTIESGLVDAIQGAIDGTKTLGDVARSVFGEISRQLISFGVNAFLGSLFPGSSFFRANGGPVSSGRSYMVGERGPEMFVPNTGGRIVPNSDMGSATNIVVNVDASGSSVEGNEADGRELGRLISVAVQSEIISQQRPGGLLA